MDSISDKNKRIAKNTIMLYLRMLVVMGVTLYTSRVILQVLGVEDYGIFTVVGGMVTMLGFVSSMMSTASQRFITYELGTGDKNRLNMVFSSCVIIHIAISIFIIILAETLGLWLFYEKLTIPPDRIDAAFWMYQSSIAIAVVTFISVPFDADIIAHERMNVYALISIIEVALKLLIVYALTLSGIDKLIMYALLLFAGIATVRLCYVIYGLRNFKETHVRFILNRPTLRSILSFAGWSFIGNFSFVCYTQGLNVLLNIFFNPVVNAARGIAVQVQTAVMQFVSSFQTAINPQITKSYAEGDLQYMHTLVFRSTRFSFFLLLCLALPLLIETPMVLELWLKEVPENTIVFTRLTLLTTLINSMANPMIISVKASGRIKRYEIIVGLLMFSILPISYVLLLAGMPATSVFITHLVMESISQCFRVTITSRLIGFSIKKFITDVFARIATVCIAAAIAPIALYFLVDDSLLSAIAVTAVAIVSVCMAVLFMGITCDERRVVAQKAAELSHRFFNLKIKSGV